MKSLALLVALAFSAAIAPAGDTLNLLPLPMLIERTSEAIVRVSGPPRVVADESLGDEAYRLETTGGAVVITCKAPAGEFYARQTLAQLGGGEIPQVRITDRPRFACRGMLLDSARHMQSIDYLKRTIDALSRFKINRLQLHLTDDVGWRVEIRKYPKLTEIGAWRGNGANRYGGFYTQAQLGEIVEYAQARFITVIPEIELPGHAQAMVASYPAVGCTGEQVPVLPEFKLSNHPLCPSNPETYALVEGVLDEVMEIFPSQVIHIGGDECPRGPWKTCPRCQAFMRDNTLRDEDALQSEFTRRVAAYLKSKGRRMQGWGEVLKGGRLGREVIVHQWLDPSVGATAAKLGNDVVVSQHEWLYLDYPIGRTPLEKVYAFDPMPPGLSEAESRRILGPQANLWTENYPTEAAQDAQIWPRMLAVAEMGWTPQQSRNWEDFAKRATAVRP